MQTQTDTIAKRQERLINAFAERSSWMDKYEYLIELSAGLKPMADEYKIEENSISGCQSSVWMVAALQDGHVYYQASSDSKITRGLIAVLLLVLDGQPAPAIQNAELTYIDKIGLRSNLSPSRANGLASIIKRMKQLAAQTI